MRITGPHAGQAVWELKNGEWKCTKVHTASYLFLKDKGMTAGLAELTAKGAKWNFSNVPFDRP
jgi:thiamine pyrophosphokinase